MAHRGRLPIYKTAFDFKFQDREFYVEVSGDTEEEWDIDTLEEYIDGQTIIPDDVEGLIKALELDNKFIDTAFEAILDKRIAHLEALGERTGDDYGL